MKILGLLTFILIAGYAASEYNLTIVHISDFNSRWFEFNENEERCTDGESMAKRCFGGFPRLLSLVNDIRSKEKNVIVLSSGEFFWGEPYNVVRGWKIANDLVPKLKIDAMSLSNMDCGEGVIELSAFLHKMKFPALCANMEPHNKTYLRNRVNRSTVLEVNGEKIGIIGYLDTGTMQSRNVLKAKFHPAIPSIAEEVEHLEDVGIDKIIVLGHSSYSANLDIIKKVKGVDIAIGEDVDLVLKTSDDDHLTPGKKNIHRNNPKDNGESSNLDLTSKLSIYTIIHPGKYVGIVRVTFDDKGRIIHSGGESVLLDSSIPQDNETLTYLKNTHWNLMNRANNRRLPEDDKILAKTSFNFESNTCKTRECSLGNFVTDAMLNTYDLYKDIMTEKGDPEKWGYVDAVVITAGSFRYPLMAGEIRMKDLLYSLYVGDFMKRVYLSGEQLLKMMEHSVEEYDPDETRAPDYFLHVSGLRVVYDVTKPPGQRVKTLSVRCRHTVNDYEPVNLYKTYLIAMPGLLAKGGDGYAEHDLVDLDDYGQPEIFLIIRYLQQKREVRPILDGRISFVNTLYLEGPTTPRKDISTSSVTSTPGISTKNISSSITVRSREDSKTFISSTDQNTKNREISITPTSGHYTTNTTSLVTPTLGTIKMRSLSFSAPVTGQNTMKMIDNRTKQNHQLMETNYNYISVMFGPSSNSLPNSTFQEENPSFNETKVVVNGSTTTENISFTTVAHINDSTRHLNRKINQPKQNSTIFSTEHSKHIDSHTPLESQTTRLENDTIEKTDDFVISNKSELFVSENMGEVFLMPDIVENFVIDRDEMSDLHQKNNELRDITSLSPTSYISVNKSSEALGMKNFSNLVNEEKRKNFTSLLMNSALTEFEKVLMDAMFEEAIENEIIFENGGADLLRHNLKTGLENILKDKMDITTLTSSNLKNSETTTGFNHPTPTENGKSFETETTSNTKTEPMEMQARNTDSAINQAPTVKTRNESINESSAVFGNDKNANYSKMPSDKGEVLKSNKQKINEVKDLLVDTVVNSVLEKVKLEFDRRFGASDIFKPNKIEEGFMLKKRTVKKQLGSTTENVKSTTDTDKISLLTLSTLIDGLENGTQMSVEVHAKNKSNFPVTDHNQSYNSTINLSSSGEHKDNDEFVGEVGWIPWII
ncbi:5'-nucleotidase [Trichonephila clavata]|uniref:5'-nucleotidase n=1 Tax=Trichonephila clavata TaxID=2740835 RepID=A0A8X6HM93_TRICU|nr:5'-nucleotidase [Trichonephila clavata]